MLNWIKLNAFISLWHYFWICIELLLGTHEGYTVCTQLVLTFCLELLNEFIHKQIFHRSFALYVKFSLHWYAGTLGVSQKCSGKQSKKKNISKPKPSHRWPYNHTKNTWLSSESNLQQSRDGYLVFCVRRAAT